MRYRKNGPAMAGDGLGLWGYEAAGCRLLYELNAMNSLVQLALYLKKYLISSAD